MRGGDAETDQPLQASRASSPRVSRSAALTILRGRRLAMFSAKRKKPEAKAWLAKCLAASPRTPEDEETLEQARKLKL